MGFRKWKPIKMEKVKMMTTSRQKKEVDRFCFKAPFSETRRHGLAEPSPACSTRSGVVLLQEFQCRRSRNSRGFDRVVSTACRLRKNINCGVNIPFTAQNKRVAASDMYVERSIADDNLNDSAVKTTVLASFESWGVGIVLKE